jgi:hypothetical protein
VLTFDTTSELEIHEDEPQEWDSQVRGESQSEVTSKTPTE